MQTGFTYLTRNIRNDADDFIKDAQSKLASTSLLDNAQAAIQGLSDTRSNLFLEMDPVIKYGEVNHLLQPYNQKQNLSNEKSINDY